MLNLIGSSNGLTFGVFIDDLQVSTIPLVLSDVIIVVMLDGNRLVSDHVFGLTP